MRRLIRLFGMLLFAFIPSRLKLVFLRINGHSIGNNCYIGLSFLNADKIILEDYSYIGHFNLIWAPMTFHMRRGSRVSTGNWITGSSDSYFELGRNSSISIGHYLDASAGLFIGSNCVVAGKGSQFFSHGITPDNLDERMSITIGDWCYIGSAVRFVPGAGVADHTFVGMGAVITKQQTDNYVLLAGIPATVIKKLPHNSVFFDRKYTKQPHHPQSYNG